jgi:hypothetical protein
MKYEMAGGLARSLQRGTREGQVEVRVTRNWHTGSITIVRPDTGEILEERAMTFIERQRTLLDGTQTTAAVAPPPQGSQDLRVGKAGHA